MARHPWLDPAPFWIAGNRAAGVLLIHGFTGAPTEVRPLGDFLAAQGYSVSGPLLPGHGVEPADLNRVRWQNWTQAVDDAYAELSRYVQQVFVAGLSLGGLLALHLAAQRPAVSGLLLFAPGLLVAERRLPLSSLLRYVRPLVPKNETEDSDLADPEALNRIWSYELYPVGGASQLWRTQRTVRGELDRITQPVILFQGRRDRAIRPDSPEMILKGIRSTDKRLVWLANSGHNLLVDVESQKVFDESLTWIAQREAKNRDVAAGNAARDA